MQFPLEFWANIGHYYKHWALAEAIDFELFFKLSFFVLLD